MKYPTRVVVRNLETNETVHDRIGDHDEHNFRLWMGKTAFWAIRNNHSMTTMPLDEGFE